MDSFPNRSDLMHFLGDYYAHGEFGVVFEAEGYGDRVVKIVKHEAKKDEKHVNASQLEFFQTVLDYEEFEGVPKIYYVLECEVNHMVKKHIEHTLLKSNAYRAIEVLGLEEGDTIGIWIMDKLENIGTDKTLSERENALKVAYAAAQIWETYQFYVSDLQTANYGQLQDGSFVIFDPIPTIDFSESVYFMEGEDLVLWFYENEVWVDGKPAKSI